MPFHWGRFRGIALNNGQPELAEIMGNNIFFDTCVYHQPGIDLLTKVVPVDNILFASEMVGAVKGIDPKTGFDFDDTKRYVDKAPRFSDADSAKIFEGNARRVYGRARAALKAACNGGRQPTASARPREAGTQQASSAIRLLLDSRFRGNERIIEASLHCQNFGASAQDGQDPSSSGSATARSRPLA